MSEQILKDYLSEYDHLSDLNYDELSSSEKEVIMDTTLFAFYRLRYQFRELFNKMIPNRYKHESK